MDESNINSSMGDGMNMPPSQRPPMSPDEAAMFAGKNDPPVSSAGPAALPVPPVSSTSADSDPKPMMSSETPLPHSEVQKSEMPIVTKMPEMPVYHAANTSQSMMPAARGTRVWVKVLITFLILIGVFLLYEYVAYRTLVRSATPLNNAQ